MTLITGRCALLHWTRDFVSVHVGQFWCAALGYQKRRLKKERGENDVAAILLGSRRGYVQKACSTRPLKHSLGRLQIQITLTRFVFNTKCIPDK